MYSKIIKLTAPVISLRTACKLKHTQLAVIIHTQWSLGQITYFTLTFCITRTKTVGTRERGRAGMTVATGFYHYTRSYIRRTTNVGITTLVVLPVPTWVYSSFTPPKTCSLC